MRTCNRARGAWGLGLGLLVWAGGCSTSAPRGADSPRQVGVSSEPLQVETWLGGTASAATGAGAGPLQVVAVGVGVPGDHVAGLVNVPAGRCALLFARGSQSVADVDLFVFADDGEPLGADEAPDGSPTLLLCPDGARRLFMSARVAAGEGIVALGVQEVPPDDAQAVARQANARNYGGPRVVKHEAWPGFDAALGAHHAALGGAWAELRRVALPVNARMPTQVSAEIGAGRCLDAFVLPGAEVAQVDLVAHDESGRIFARGEASGASRSLVICSSEAGRVTLAVRPHSGRGLAVLALSTSRPGGAQELSPEAARFDLFPVGGADAAHERQRAALAALAPPPRTPTRGSVALGGRASVPLALAEGCARVDVWSSGELLGVELRAYDPAGELVAEGRGIASGTLFSCGAARKLRLDVEASRRGGAFSVEVRPDRGLDEGDPRPPSPLAPAPPPALAPSAAQAKPEPGSGDASKERATPVKPEPGSGDVSKERATRGQRLVKPEPGSGDVSKERATRGQRLVKPEPGSGDVSKERATRGQRLASQALAASRLLSRMADSGALRMPREVGQVHQSALSPETLERYPAVVPAGRCLEVYLALGAGGVGAQLTLLDAASGEVLDRSRGAHSTSARACAPAAAGRELVVELGAPVAPAQALYAQRLLHTAPAGMRPGSTETEQPSAAPSGRPAALPRR